MEISLIGAIVLTVAIAALLFAGFTFIRSRRYGEAFELVDATPAKPRAVKATLKLSGRFTVTKMKKAPMSPMARALRTLRLSGRTNGRRVSYEARRTALALVRTLA